LSVFQIEVPPLRERKEDIPLIADVMLQNLNQKHGTRVSGLEGEVVDLLLAHNWPGNVRELRNVIERAVIVTGTGLVRVQDLPSPAFGPGNGRHAKQVPNEELLRPGQLLSSVEAAYIKLTLEFVQGNRKLAAESLGISLRTLQTRISDLREDSQAASPGA